MEAAWAFKRATPGDRARESQVEKFFSSDAVANRANAIVREGIQNSLDAAPEDAVVRVRIKVGKLPKDRQAELLSRYELGFSEHLNADGVLSKLPHPPSSDDEFRFLAFEDFGTTGLHGDPATWWPDEDGKSEPFFNYFRAEGISGKSEGARGRHGVGRLVFMFASRARAMFGLTIRAKDGRPEELLMGTAVLRNHRLQNVPFLPDGWFGIPADDVQGLTLPVREQRYLDKFKATFGVKRGLESGLSVVVPWLSADVTHAELLRAVVGGYYYPILAGKLIVELVDEADSETHIMATTIDAVLPLCGADFSAQIGPMISLAKAALGSAERVELQGRPPTEAPKWDSSIVGEQAITSIHEKLEAGVVVAVRVPVVVRAKPTGMAQSFFDVYLTRDQSAGDGQIHFIREGIIISDVRPRRTSGVRALVVVEEGALASFLGDAENPSHTQWQKDMVKDKYFYAPAGIDFVTQSVPQLLALISQQQRKPDTSLLLDLFAVPSSIGVARPNLGRSEPKNAEETVKEKLEIKRGKKLYAIDQRGDGFVIRSGIEPVLGLSLSVKVAYGVRKGNPLTKYNPADFSFGKDGVGIAVRGCEVVASGPNWAIVRVTEKEFEFTASGFDTSHRDLYVDVRVLAFKNASEVEDAPAT